MKVKEWEIEGFIDLYNLNTNEIKNNNHYGN
jgi:hypothetical protein